ncbi:serine/threonine-protein kinase [Nonomuraea sp. NPDC049684]|uniref:serine/threonine-protein kinase n=1 Tax=Nonomuraea sp. NPDC049684 TaxID=3364356 RepID=UPI00379A2DA7
MRPLTVGDPVVIGRYLLLGRLGTGGMGVVYLAEHPQGGLVALKTPHAVHLHDATLRARFAEEVAFSRRLVPFCTAAVIEDGVEDGRPYLVTEYIPGPALSQVVKAGGALTPDLAYGVALGVAAALVAVHEAGLVHRDLKPGNVLLSPAGPRVIDFGIARDVDTLAAHTQAGQVMGSPGWVAPERLTGGPALPASDVFAWGCLVAYAASGHHPFGGGEADVLTRRILFDPPRLDGVPVLLRPAVEAALAKDPGSRPGSAALLRALLASGGVGDPWDLRRAVSDVLDGSWAEVPHPAVGGPVTPAEEPAGAERGNGRGNGRGSRRGNGRGSGRRGRAKAGAHLSHAGFAALATVSIAAVTVIAASGGDALSLGGGSLLPDPAVVQPQDGVRTTERPTATPGGVRPSARVAPAASAATPAVPGTRSRTPGGQFAILTPEPDRWTDDVRRSRPSRAARPSGTSGPGDLGDPGGEEPGPCAGPPGRRRGGGGGGRRDCPRPSGSISTIPQDGPGESPGPSVSGPATPTATGAS